MLQWFFGFPGAGKTHVAGLFSQMTGIPRYEGDDFHTEDDRRAVEAGTFTLAHRHAQLERIHLAIRTAGISDALVTHPLPDKASRELVRGLSGHAARLIYVTAPLALVKERLATRKDHHFSARLLAAWIPRHWEEPEDEDCFVFENGSDNDVLQEQLTKLRLWGHGNEAPVS
jgi:gluconate kinase